MPAVLTLAVLTLAVLTVAGLATASAADMPAHTRLGAIFAEPAPHMVRRHAEIETEYVPGVFAPEIDVRPLVNGYYGKPNAYFYRPYYSSTTDAYTRLPYACGFYGYC
ncbi:hypothetical protein [Afipia sp. P52-10]|uniref:hypothetical protein n=1 Tax=Afipia sp. P52-10 TaxID=1429916 RepID=UPI0004B737F4|nr:hypothetical protein [Afipia sp. P52-10]